MRDKHIHTKILKIIVHFWLNFNIFKIMCAVDKVVEILRKWKENSNKNCIGASIKKFKDLEVIDIRCNFIWSYTRSIPPFLLQYDEENAEIINPILKHSIQTQRSVVLGDCDFLLVQNCFLIHGMLIRYFKCIPGKQFKSKDWANFHILRYNKVFHISVCPELGL